MNQPKNVSDGYKAMRDAAQKPGCCGGEVKKGVGPLQKYKKVPTIDGDWIIVPKTHTPTNPIMDAQPPFKKKDSPLDSFVDGLSFWIIVRITNARQWWYAIKSVWNTKRWGKVRFVDYYYRSLHCDHQHGAGLPCEHRVTSSDNGQHYCAYDPEGCGCPRAIDLEVMLQSAKFVCPIGRFKQGRSVSPPWELVQVNKESDDGVHSVAGE